MEAEGEEKKIANPIIEEEEEDDDPPLLSSQALEALKEFLNEQAPKPSNNDQEEEGGPGTEVSLVTENWRLSQFWYEPHTAHTVADEVQRLSRSNTASCRVACVACPTLYAYLKKTDPSISAQLLEYDRRFEQYGSDFTFYDYNQPEELPEALKHGCQVVIADPPYLSRECLAKVAQTMKFLAQPGESYLLLLTGDVLTEIAAELLGMYPCSFKPQHSSKLGNEFRLFTNYDPGERLGGWEQGK